MPTWEEHKSGVGPQPGRYNYVAPEDVGMFQPDEIRNMFPVPLATFTLGRDFTEVERLTFDDLLSTTARMNGGNSVTSDTYVFEREELSDLAAFCTESVRSVMRYAYGASNDVLVRITQSWLTHTQIGGYHHMHHHPNSLLSGVLYIKTSKGDGINFIKVANGDASFRYRLLEQTVFNCDSERAEATEGTLLVFPSSVWHTVYRSNTDGRISLSFNTFMNGALGDPDYYHELFI
ncbi:MAG: putative 2OG-Fe(II) oxygenase [Bacteroidota bacterium]